MFNTAFISKFSVFFENINYLYVLNYFILLLSTLILVFIFQAIYKISMDDEKNMWLDKWMTRGKVGVILFLYIGTISLVAMISTLPSTIVNFISFPIDYLIF